MKPFLLLSLAALVVLPLTSCEAFRKKSKEEEAKPEAAKPVQIGVVELVNPEARFVIIHLNSQGQGNALPTDTVISSVGQTGGVAKLKVTPERKTIFMTADIVSGNPEKGDAVLTGPVDSLLAAANANPGAPAGPTGPPSVSINPSNVPGAIQAPATPLPAEPDPSEFLRPVPSRQ